MAFSILSKVSGRSFPIGIAQFSLTRSHLKAGLVAQSRFVSNSSTCKEGRCRRVSAGDDMQTQI